MYQLTFLLLLIIDMTYKSVGHFSKDIIHQCFKMPICGFSSVVSSLDFLDSGLACLGRFDRDDG